MPCDTEKVQIPIFSKSILEPDIAHVSIVDDLISKAALDVDEMTGATSLTLIV
jgi:hypothetical protein